MEIIINPAETYTPGDTADVRDVDAWFDRPGDFGAPGTVRLTQYDTHPIIAVHMYYGHEPYALPDGGGVNIRQKKTDGEPVYNPALGVSEDKTIAYFQVTKQMSVAPGLSKAVVEVVIDGKTAGTAIFILNIDKNPVQDDDVESTGEYKTLQDYVNDAMDSAGSASDSAADALRSKNDADKAKTAAESAKTAAENAKTAAESAKTSAESARTGAQNAESAARELKEQAEAAAEKAKENATSAASDALRAEEAADRAQQITQGALGYYETPEILSAKHPSADAGNWAIVGSTDTIWVWDTENPGWTDSGNKTDLSQYYTKTETDDLLKNVKIDMDAVPTESSQNAVQSGGVWSELQKKPNPNLLDNWYFVGGGSQQGGGRFPINQRGQTKYTSATYTIDRWEERISNTSLTVNPEYITIVDQSSGEGYAFLTQSMENPKEFAGKQVTFSVLVRPEKDTQCNATIRDDVESQWTAATPVSVKAVEWNLVSVTVTVKSALSYLGFQAWEHNTQYDLLAMKLELGDHQTLAHKEGDTWVLNEIPNFQQELAKCQRYQIPIAQYSAFSVAEINPNHIDFNVSTPETMRGIPVFSDHNEFVINRQTGFNVSAMIVGAGWMRCRAYKQSHGITNTTSVIYEGNGAIADANL